MMEMNKAHFQQALQEAEAKHAKELEGAQAKAGDAVKAVLQAQEAVKEAEAAKGATEAALLVRCTHATIE